ncbi:MAG: ribonuclease HI family protein [Nanoarchaeota archaeon]
MSFNIFTDGASRGNPGKAGIGIVIYKNDKCIEEISDFIGNKTNNEAEYFAIIRALEKLLELNSNNKANLFSDSELLIKQINGIYKVKSKNLIELNNKVRLLLKKLDVNFVWIPREENKIADLLANKGIDINKSSNKGNVSQFDRFKNKLNNQDSILNELLIDKSFFGKINCFKIQLNNNLEVYFHMGLLKNNKWDWKKVKMSDVELGQIIHLLKHNEGKVAFFHKFNQNKTQIWCNKAIDRFSIKIDEYSKNFTIGEFEALNIIIEECIRRRI